MGVGSLKSHNKNKTNREDYARTAFNPIYQIVSRYMSSNSYHFITRYEPEYFALHRRSIPENSSDVKTGSKGILFDLRSRNFEDCLSKFEDTL